MLERTQVDKQLRIPMDTEQRQGSRSSDAREPWSAMSPTTLRQFQGMVGNRAVSGMVASAQRQSPIETAASSVADRQIALTGRTNHNGATGPTVGHAEATVQRQPPPKAKVELPVPLESVESIRARLATRQNGLNQFLTASKQDVANIRNHFAFVNGVYKRSFDHHALVVAQAKAQAESKQAWVDFAFGVGVGVGIGLMSEALIAGRLAEVAYETLAEVGAELVEGGIARLVKPEVPKAELLPELAPELKQIRSLQFLDELNVLVVQMAVPGTFVFTDPLVQSERVLAELRLIAAGAAAEHRKLTDTEIRERFAKIAKFETASAQAEAKLVEAKATFDKLRTSYFGRPAIADEQVEQDIWIPWIAAQDIETFFAPTLFNPLIRRHLRDIGVTTRLGTSGLPYRDSILGEYWPHNPSTDEERAVVASYKLQKDRAAAEAKKLPAFWNKVFLQATA